MMQSVALRLSFVADLLVTVVGAAAITATVGLGFEQSPLTVDTPLPSFEVASVKPNHSVEIRPVIWFRPGRFTATDATLKQLIPRAFNVADFQVLGGPSWINSERYDIEAKEPDGFAEELQELTQDRRRERLGLMLQSLLFDRFKLKVSHATKELPVYNLVVSKNGPKILEAKAGDTYPNGIKGPDGVARPGLMRMRPGQFTGQAIPLSSLVMALSQLLSCTILDQTGLKGNYVINLQWAPDQGTREIFQTPPNGSPGLGNASSPDSSGPSLFTAVQEQLGLRLVSTKGPVDVIVIDHIERPSEN